MDVARERRESKRVELLSEEEHITGMPRVADSKPS